MIILKYHLSQENQCTLGYISPNNNEDKALRSKVYFLGLIVLIIRPFSYITVLTTFPSEL